MNQEYFDKVTELEKMNASDQYILGWQEGYQDAPEVEEQRVTDAYQAGYEDGKNNNFDNVEKFKDWPTISLLNHKLQESSLIFQLNRYLWFDP